MVTAQQELRGSYSESIVAPLPHRIHRTSQGSAGMPQGAVGRVTVSVSDSIARSLVTDAGKQEGWEIAQDATLEAWAGESRLPSGARLWVYDLAPWTDRAVQVLGDVRAAHPAVPILLFSSSPLGPMSPSCCCGAARFPGSPLSSSFATANRCCGSEA